MVTEENNEFKILILEGDISLAQDLEKKLAAIGYSNFHTRLTYEDATREIESHQFDFGIVDISIHGENSGIKIGELLNYHEVPYIFLTSFSDDSLLKEARKFRPYGYLIKPVNELELKSTIEIAKYRATYGNLTRVEKERQFLLEINSSMVRFKDRYEFFARINKSLRKLFDLDRSPHIALLNDDGTYLTLMFDLDSPEVDDHFISLVDSFNNFPVTDKIRELMDMGEPLILSLDDMWSGLPIDAAREALTYIPTKSALFIPLKSNRKQLGYFIMMSSKEDFFGAAHFKIFEAVANHISIAVENILYFEKLHLLKNEAEQEKKYLHDEINARHNVDGFIGHSPAVESIREKIKVVSRTDTSVLIYGETGTGKELVARSIHGKSGNTKPMVKINCAALPSQLIESELFGHEKGSFTGALKKVIGKFEMAHNGIIFLDEIGELPIDLQPKLLRVIQEKEILRIGGASPIKLNAKIIAATNRDLEKEVQAGNFRADLYYRLNVFPINIPPLRHRKDEIPELAELFLKRFSRKLGRGNLKFSKNSLPTMLNYEWPGNIRELQHVIEREVILSKGKLIDITPELLITRDSPSKAYSAKGATAQGLKTYKKAEKDLIINTLKYTKGKVRGPGGAAEILDINPSTLESRIRKLGIVKKLLFES
ncbi:MAG: sigma 54-interacting transcriptional regulator [Bacteroidota bacterium]